MATLMLAGHPIIGSVDLIGASLSLNEWLEDDWAILFSHPDDFVRSELELDRWVALARPAFAASSIRPLALAKPGRPLDCGWVTQLAGDGRAVLLHDPAACYLHSASLHAQRLHEDIEGMDQRFVMVIDASLRRRKTYAYGAPERLPSPLDFVRWASGLRNADEPHEPPADFYAGYAAAAPRTPWQARDVFQRQSAA